MLHQQWVSLALVVHLGMIIQMHTIVNGGKGEGKERIGNIGIGGSCSTSRCRNLDADYDNGSKSKGMRRGKNGNIGIDGSSSTFGCSHPDAYYDNGICGGTNDNETKTSQHARGSQQSIPNHPSQRPMITLYYGGVIAHLARYYSTGSAMYRALEKVMSSRYSNISSHSRWDASRRATYGNINVGNDLCVLKSYATSWIDQSD
ncbi:hypothetical protein Tco_0309909 [Tanacetum coccineum]